MSYNPPLPEIEFVLRRIAGLDQVLAAKPDGDIDLDLVPSILEEAAKLARDVIAPLNRPADLEGAHFSNGNVTTPKGWPDVYRAWMEGGWNTVALPVEWGGMGGPHLLNTATMEMWTGACMAFGLGPVVTQGVAEALLVFGDDALKAAYLPKLVSGEWSAAMALTEAQAGSDLAPISTRAEPMPDGGWRLKGQKIFITYGDHDMTPNIIHLVLARTPDAPAGTRGLSLFLVPKHLPGEGDALGPRNAMRPIGIEHKMGIHGSPTCTMEYGLDGEGATGWLVGEVNKGLQGMFRVMNAARLATGLQGVAIAERAYQQALDYARNRRQGGGQMIIEHPDVKRMLMTMRTLVAASRAVAYVAAAAIDRHENDHGDAAASALAGFLTPIVKAYCSDCGVEVSSLGVQVHGGMGYVEETGAAQHFRDARIIPIYEGTNGIQAIDLLMRKTVGDKGAQAHALVAEYRSLAAQAAGSNQAAVALAGRGLNETLDALDAALAWLLQEDRAQGARLAAATPYLRLFSLAAGGAYLLRGALAATEEDGAVGRQAIANAAFFAAHVGVAAPGLARTITSGADTVMEAEFS